MKKRTPGLNRTKVELKLLIKGEANTSELRLNRTKVELKRFGASFNLFFFSGLNRTKVELKRLAALPVDLHFTRFESNQSGIETLFQQGYIQGR